MKFSDYDQTAGQQFTTQVTKLPDGTYQASAKTAPELGTFKSATLSGAVQKINDAIASHVANNYGRK